MWNKISKYIDSGKKIKISGDKLFGLLLRNNFNGKIEIKHSMGVETVFLKDEEIFTEKRADFLAFITASSLFSLYKEANFPKIPTQNKYQYFFEMINSLPQGYLNQKIKPFENDSVSFNPELTKLSFLNDILKKYEGEKSVTMSKIKKNKDNALIYYLLILNFASIIKSKETNSTKKEKVVTPTPKIQISPEQQAKKTIEKLEQYKSILSLFKITENTTSKEIQTEYRKIARKLHPDQFMNAGEEFVKKAEETMTIINDLYAIVKEEKNREILFSLEKKYGHIRTKEDFEKYKELESISSKAHVLFKLKNFGVAFKIYKELYEEYNIVDLLEKAIIAYYKNNRPEQDRHRRLENDKRATVEEKQRKLIKYIEELKTHKPVPLDLLYIKAEAHEKLGEIQKCKKTLREIADRDGSQTRASSWLKKIEFYEKIK